MRSVHIDWKDIFPPRVGQRGTVATDDGVVDPEASLFADQAALRGVDGFYAEDAAECASRRVDLRGPTDHDPGPIPMEEAPPDLEGAIRLTLGDV